MGAYYAPVITVLEDDGHGGGQVREMPSAMELTFYGGKWAHKQANKIMVDRDKYSKEGQANGGVQIGSVQLSLPCHDFGEECSRKEWRGKPWAENTVGNVQGLVTQCGRCEDGGRRSEMNRDQIM